MQKPTFLTYEKPTLTTMVQGDTPDRIEELVRLSRDAGAEAFGMQFCKLRPEFQNADTYRRLFAAAAPQPIYATFYRQGNNVGKSDEELAEGLLEIASCGATLCDVMCDYFDAQPGEYTTDPVAVKKQKELIERLHREGAEVLMSAHVHKFIPAERVLEIAMAHYERGADIAKIVVKAKDMAEQIECMRIITLLKEKLPIPFLFLAGGECRVLRRIGDTLGSCMSLSVYEYDQYATKVQPLLRHVKAIRDNMRGDN